MALQLNYTDIIPRLSFQIAIYNKLHNDFGPHLIEEIYSTWDGKLNNEIEIIDLFESYNLKAEFVDNLKD